MHARKHDILSKLSDSLWPVLHKAAVAHRVTVDEVVRAGLRDSAVSEAAMLAAGDVSKARPDAFESITDWPRECAFCLDLIDGEMTQCPHCHRVGCTGCVTGRGCPPCVEGFRVAREGSRRVAEAAPSA